MPYVPREMAVCLRNQNGVRNKDPQTTGFETYKSDFANDILNSFSSRVCMCMSIEKMENIIYNFLTGS